jgi:hypothetical protein
MAASRFVDVTDKEISEIKINSVPKNTIDLCKNTQTAIIRLRLGQLSGNIHLDFVSANIPRYSISKASRFFFILVRPLKLYPGSRGLFFLSPSQ